MKTPTSTCRLLGLMLLGAVLLQSASRAVLVGEGSLEGLVRSCDAVVKGRVIAVEKPPFEHRSFTIQRLATLKGEGASLPLQIAITAAAPIWPEDLDFPYRKGAVGLFFLEERERTYGLVNNVHAILPALEAAPEGEPAPGLETRLVGELVPVLKRMRSDWGTARLLSLMSELTGKSGEELFTPYLRAEGEWTRRGALGALLRLNPTPERVEQANQDFRAFLKAPKSNRDFRFGRLYRVIEDGAPVFLPVYRSVVDAPSSRGFLEIAVRGLRRSGQREDVPRLYRYIRHRSAYIRHEALDGLCRILKIPLKRPQVTTYLGPLSPAAAEQERRMEIAVRKALRAEGLR